MIWVNQVVQGVLLGGYYALLACGLSFLYGVLRVINLAHGSLAVVAAFLVFALADRLGVNPFLGLAIALPVMAGLGLALHRLVFARSARAGVLVPLLATFGLAVVIDNSLFQAFGADTRSLAPFFDSLAYDSWVLPGGIAVGQLPVGILGAAVVVLGGLQLLLARTSLGRRIRAAAEDPDTAELVGVDSRAVYGAAVALAMATVALAGVALALRATFDPYAGPLQLIFAFEAAVIGGAGSLWGTLLGGVALGIAQSVGAQLSPRGFLIAGHALFLAILLARLYVAAALRRLLAPAGGVAR